MLVAVAVRLEPLVALRQASGPSSSLVQAPRGYSLRVAAIFFAGYRVMAARRCGGLEVGHG